MPRPGTVFFGGLPTTFDRKDIERLVAGYGPYEDIDFKPRPHFNFAFVDFCNRRDAEYAIRELHGTYIQPGYKITVEFSQGRGYKPRDPPYRRYRSRTPPRSPRRYDRRHSPPRGHSPSGRGRSRSPSSRYDRRHRSPDYLSRSPVPRGRSRSPHRRSRRSLSRGKSVSRSPRHRSVSRGRWRGGESPSRRRTTVDRSRRSPSPGAPHRRRRSTSPAGSTSPAPYASCKSPTSPQPTSTSPSAPTRRRRSGSPPSPRRTSRSPGKRADMMDSAARVSSPMGKSLHVLNGDDRQVVDGKSETEVEEGGKRK